MKINKIGIDHFLSELQRVGNGAVLFQLENSDSKAKELWLEELNEQISNGHQSFEIGSQYTKTSLPLLVQFNKDMICCTKYVVKQMRMW